MAYSEQVGTKRHEGGVIGEMYPDRNKQATATDRKVSFSFQPFHYMKQQFLHFLLHFGRRMNMVIQPYKGDNQSFVPGSQRIQQQMLVLPISLTYLTFHQITLYRTFEPLLGHADQNGKAPPYLPPQALPTYTPHVAEKPEKTCFHLKKTLNQCLTIQTLFFTECIFYHNLLSFIKIKKPRVSNHKVTTLLIQNPGFGI